MKIQITAEIDTDSQNDREIVEELMELVQIVRQRFDQEGEL